MLVPRYWAWRESTVSSTEGHPYRLRCWGCSPDSQEDAEADAQRRLAALIARMEEGHSPDHVYPYGVSLLREMLLHELPGPEGQPAAIVTRNRYGSLVLNAARTLFVDIDLPPDTLLRRLVNLLRGSKLSLEERVMQQLQEALGGRDAAYRIYRTAAGFRAVCTSHLHEPGSNDSEALMKRLRADRSFVLLCRVQKCFRARLTPKPWRIGQPIPRFLYPFDSPETEAAFQAWLQDYDNACGAWATCRLVAEVGTAPIHPEVQSVIELHDLATRCQSDLPLA